MHAKRSLGQHFLIDRRAAARIVRALRAGPEDAVLEIGPGRGALTHDLVRAAGRIAAVELDSALAAKLGERFGEARLLILERDVLQLELADVLAALGRPSDARLTVVGNLPYNISKPVAQKLVRDRALVDRAVLMFQKEVAERLTARPGSRRYGPLGVLAGLAYSIETLFDLQPPSFSPPPQVVSTVTRWSRLAAPLRDDDETRLRSVLAVCFARRRRTLRNNLRAALGDSARVDTLLREAGIDGGLRAEAVAPEGFMRLASLWERSALL